VVTYRLKDSAQAAQQRTNDSKAEVSRLDAAIATVDAALGQIDAALRAEEKPAEADVFAAHRMLLGDPSLRERVLQLMGEAHLTAESAVYQAGEEQAQQLIELDDPYLSARASDVRDVVSQIQRVLGGEASLGERLSGPAIIVAADLGPSDLMSVSRDRLLGFALLGGGLTAHATILARGLGIPAVIGLGEGAAQAFVDGMMLALDGGSGEVVIAPSAERIAATQQAADAANLHRDALRARRDLATVTRDGHVIGLVANAATPAEARTAADWGAAGIGLLRTELLFLERPTLPSEEEQLALYRAVAAELAGKPIVVRTLDVGGDKELPAFPLPKEENPFLGWRGIRIGLSQHDILVTQLRALLRASAEADIRIMLPMIATVGELLQARSLLEVARAQLAAAGQRAGTPQLGIMIEVPAAALQADQLARHADFFSIGTNDLTQYTLACDRTNERVADLYQPLEPAVLRLIALTAEAAQRHGRHVAVCGELAGDPQATTLLIGLGVEELSCAPSFIPLVRDAVRSTDYRAAQALAQQALAAESAAEVRSLLKREV
jgi:phosphotransferase system enzyme I (PtsI)